MDYINFLDNSLHILALTGLCLNLEHGVLVIATWIIVFFIVGFCTPRSYLPLGDEFLGLAIKVNSNVDGSVPAMRPRAVIVMIRGPPRRTIQETQQIHRSPEWQEALSRGGIYASKLRDPATRHQSEYTKIEQLKAAGWILREHGPGSSPREIPAAAYASKGIKRANDIAVSASNDTTFNNDYARKIPPTGGWYSSIFNIAGRSIVAASNASPRSRARHKPLLKIPGYGSVPWQQRMPTVHHWSDVIAVQWSRQVPRPATHCLKYIWRENILTCETLAIVKEAVTVYGLHAYWPGLEYQEGSEEYLALLGTPHGRGIAHLLHEHPQEVGVKRVGSITVFTTDEDKQDESECSDTPIHYHLLFTLTD